MYWYNHDMIYRDRNSTVPFDEKGNFKIWSSNLFWA